MGKLDTIFTIADKIIESSAKILFFNHKCQIISSVISDLKYKISILDMEKIKIQEIPNLEKKLTNLLDFFVKLQNEDFLWSFIRTKSPFDISIDINRIVSQIKISTIRLGAKKSEIEQIFELPKEELVDDVNNIQYFLQKSIQKLEQERKGVEDLLKRVQHYSDNDEQSNSDELNKYPKYKIKSEEDIEILKTTSIYKNDDFEYFPGCFKKTEDVTVLKLNNPKKFKRLLSVLTVINHPYVELFKGAYFSDSDIYLVTNRHGSKLSDILYGQINNSKSFFEKGDKTILAFKIAQAMSYLHSRSVIHRLLNSSHIFVTKTENGYEIKPTVVGFRNSRLISNESTNFMSTLNISPSNFYVSYFRAPELIDGPYDEKVDVFAFAGILYELIKGSPPFVALSQNEVIEKLRNEERPRDDLPEEASADLRSLLEKCWSQDPKDRFSFDEIIKEMVSKQIVLPCDSEASEAVKKFYMSKRIKNVGKAKCVDAFGLIRTYIGRAFQYKFELLSIQSILNTYQIALTSAASPDVDDDKISEEERKNYQSLYDSLHKLQDEIAKLSKDNYQSNIDEIRIERSKKKSLRKSKNASSIQINVLSVSSNLKECMENVYCSMKNLGFSDLKEYEPDINDLFYDFSELKFFFSRFYKKKKDSNVYIFRSEIDAIDSFVESINEEYKDASTSASFNRLKYMLTPYKEYEIDSEILDESDSKLIGEGGNGKVYREYLNGEKVAVKKITEFEYSEQALTRLRMEIQSLILLKHKYVVEFFGYCLLSKDEIWIVTKYYEGGSLAGRIIDKEDVLSPTERTKVAFKLARAMSFVHSKGRLHRDLKPGNVMMDGVDPKLIDFGFSSPDNRALCDDLQLGTVNYMAPEVISKNKSEESITLTVENEESPTVRKNILRKIKKSKNKNVSDDAFESEGMRYDSKSDVFSFAMILFELAKSSVPYEEIKDEAEIKNAILNGERPNISGLPIHLHDLIEECWDQDPEMRPSFEEIINIMSRLNIMFPESDEIEIANFYQEESSKI